MASSSTEQQPASAIPGFEQNDVLTAMLRIAEDEIKAKDEQTSLLQHIIATNEKELIAKDRRIAELEAYAGGLNDQIEQFKSLFDRYLSKAEAARMASVFQPLAPGVGPSQ